MGHKPQDSSAGGPHRSEPRVRGRLPVASPATLMLSFLQGSLYKWAGFGEVETPPPESLHMGAPLEAEELPKKQVGFCASALMHKTLTIRVWLVLDYNVFSPLCEIISRVHFLSLFILVGMNWY